MTANTCNGCAGPVRVRRPSQTGNHWCQEKECQAKKQRFLRANRRSIRRGELVGDVPVISTDQRDFLEAAFGLRVTCGKCGRDNAVRGYFHPTPDRDLCNATGDLGAAVGLPILMLAYGLS